MALGSFLKSKLPEISARQIKRGIEANLCRINDRVERFASAIVGTGDSISFYPEEIKKTVKKPSVHLSNAILYRDDAVIVINKPAGIASDSEELKMQVLVHAKNAALVHRLDRDTTGLLMFACNSTSLKKMEELFKLRKVTKTYLALVDGHFEKKQGRLDTFFGKKHAYEGQTLWGSQKTGLRAVTDWQVERQGRSAALVRCHPETGRTHQIRVHMSELGHPILGDYQYGRSFNCSYRANRCLLHAWRLSFEHPVLHQIIEIEAPLPADFQKAIEEVIDLK